MMDDWEAYVVNVANHKEGNLGTYERSLYSVLDGFKQGGSSRGQDLSKGVSVTQAKFESFERWCCTESAFHEWI